MHRFFLPLRHSVSLTERGEALHQSDHLAQRAARSGSA